MAGGDGKMCLVSGIFYNELDPDVSSIEELNDLFKHVRIVSENSGYQVIENMKEHNVPVLTSNF